MLSKVPSGPNYLRKKEKTDSLELFDNFNIYPKKSFTKKKNQK